jgi:hypothetical protein
MVMQQAIKDKTEQYVKEQEAAAMDMPGFQISEQQRDEIDDDDLDAMLDEEDESILRQMAEARMAEIRAAREEDQKNKILGHGDYREITEQEFLPTVTKTQYCVVHFFHNDFERCKIVDMHLQRICKEHLETRFVRLNADKAPFFI